MSQKQALCIPDEGIVVDGSVTADCGRSQVAEELAVAVVAAVFVGAVPCCGDEGEEADVGKVEVARRP